jgi:hypothetical protein
VQKKCEIASREIIFVRRLTTAKIFPPRYGFSGPLSHEYLTGVVSPEAEDKAAPFNV